MNSHVCDIVVETIGSNLLPYNVDGSSTVRKKTAAMSRAVHGAVLRYGRAQKVVLDFALDEACHQTPCASCHAAADTGGNFHKSDDFIKDSSGPVHDSRVSTRIRRWLYGCQVCVARYLLRICKFAVGPVQPAHEFDHL